MESKTTHQINLYIYYTYEDRQWVLDLISTGREESLQSRKELQSVYANRILHSHMYIVVQQKKPFFMS